MSKPNIITVSRSKRGTSVKARGAAAEVLFGLLTSKFVQQAGPEWSLYTIHFEDHGQGMLEWDVDATGLVVGCRPRQADVWCGRKVIGAPHPGSKVCIQWHDRPSATIKYPVLKITQVIGTLTAAEQAAGGA